jgi:hypothetical protein
MLRNFFCLLGVFFIYVVSCLCLGGKFVVGEWKKCQKYMCVRKNGKIDDVLKIQTNK